MSDYLFGEEIILFLQISLWMNHLWIYHLEKFDANNIQGLVSFLKNLIDNHNIRNILIDKGHVHHEKKNKFKKESHTYASLEF
jgi:hypothetical protein